MPRDGLGRLTYPRDADEIYGGDGDDVLVSYSGADILDGGAGNDSIEGYSNALNINAYRVRFGVGSGLDTLSDYGAELSEAARPGQATAGLGRALNSPRARTHRICVSSGLETAC